MSDIYRHPDNGTPARGSIIEGDLELEDGGGQDVTTNKVD